MNLVHFNKLLSKYYLLINHTQEMLIFFDINGKIIDCNEQANKELGYGNEILRLSIYEVFKKAFLYEDKQLKLDMKYKDNLKEAVAYRKNQTCFPVDLKVSIINRRNEYIGLCTAIDITERKESASIIKHLEEELKSANQIGTELIANVTHELRTPINGIMGFSNNLLETPLNQKQIEDIKVIKRCCMNMNATINDILDFAKITNNKLEVEYRDFNFREMINHVIEINSIQINEKGLKLLVVISPEIPEIITGDELRLSQILNNLLSNAIKFTSIGYIGLEVSRISSTDQNIELFFMLFDSGIGISREDQDKLFKNFSQVDSSITRRFGGTGLGLSICKKLVEAMDGTIQVSSEKNKGSTFSFSVRLGIPQNSDENSKSDEDIKFEETSQIKSNFNISEMEYIKKRLEEREHKHSQKDDKREEYGQIVHELAGIIEKLFICVEMENWELAEEIVCDVKKRMPNNHEMSKRIFRLLLTVRKESYDESINILQELKKGTNKEE